MSLPRSIALAKTLNTSERAVLAFYLEELDREQGVVLQAEPASASVPVEKKTAAQRAREYRERKSSQSASHEPSRSVTRKSDERHAASRDGVTNGVTESDAASHGVTPRAGTRALSSAESAEKEIEKKSTGEGASHEANATVTRTVTRTVTQPVTRDVTRASVTRDVTRDVTKSAGGELMAKAEAVRVALTDGFKRHGIAAPARHLSVPHSQPVIDIARSVEESDLPKLIEGFFADDGTRKKGYPIAWLANNPAAYMTTEKPQAVDVDTLPLPPTLTEAERRAVSAERAIKRAPVPELCLVRPPPADVLASAHRKMIESRAS